MKNQKLKTYSYINAKWASNFYNELNIVQTVTAFKKCARSYSTEIIKDRDGNMNDPSGQLEASKPVARKGFKYQLTLKVLPSKQKQNGDTEFSTVYFNSNWN